MPILLRKLATFPRIVLQQMVRYPQFLAEHISGWQMIFFGYRIIEVSVMLPSSRMVGLAMMVIGIMQLITVSFVPRKFAFHGFATGAAFTMWLFLWVLSSRVQTPGVVSGAYPVNCIGCAIAYWSMNRGTAMRDSR